MGEPRQAGLRLQIVLALAGLLLLAFVPMFFAVASLSRATVLDLHERSARALGRAIATHVADARESGDPHALERALAAHVGLGGVDAICVFGPGGTRLSCAGSPTDTGAMTAPTAGAVETATPAHGTGGRGYEITTPATGGTVVTRLRLGGESDRAAQLVQLTALYMVTFALALVVFAYFALTRLIVRPVEQLVDAADRVASGARTLRVPRRGARELIELGTSVQSMTEKLLAEEAKLLVKVGELTETTTRLSQTQAQLVRSERMASVGRLAAGVAHEIGNPIAALIGLQELLLDGDLPAQESRDFLRRMRKETERIHVVLRDLLDFARPERPGEPGGPPPTPADVARVADDVASLVRPQKAFRSVRIETDVTPGLEVALPAPRLTQVLLNMAMNAGAAIASQKREDGRMSVRARADGGRVRIEIEDDGPGVPPELRERLFEPFVTTKAVGEGTGLGLAVCRGLVESAGGEVSLDAGYMDGARFVVVLPAA